jgi:hypothetical protein
MTFEREMTMKNDRNSGVFNSSTPLFIRLLVLSATLVLIGANGATAAEEMNRTGYTSSTICSYCHADIYKGWEKSAHARAYSDRTFQESSRQAYMVSKVLAKNFCVKCHAPTAVYGPSLDLDANLPVTREGVGCDFCHTIEKVDLADLHTPYKADVGGQKNASMRLLGPKPNPSGYNPAAHQAAYAAWFNKSELCAGCHEMANANGLKVGETYTEWKTSKYAAEGVQCQGCHMHQMAGTPYESSVKKAAKTTIPDHSLSPEAANLQGAVDLKLISAAPLEKGAYQVDLAMTNVKAGHNIPTGSPVRTLALEVTLQGDGMERVVQVKTFGKRIIDKNGNWLVNDTDAQMNGTKLKFNTSLRPMERREVRFVFANVPAGKVKVTARAFMTRNPVVDTDEHVLIPLGEAAK